MNTNTRKSFQARKLTVYEIITNHYYELKAIAKRETMKFNRFNKDLDEDIFHNVLLAMAETLGGENYLITVKQAKGYFCNSFKNALCREVLYARNKYKDGDGFEECLFRTKSGNIDTRIDYNTIISDIEGKYGKNYCDIFVDFISGVTLRELNEKYNIQNSDYIIRKTKKYIKKEYPEFKIVRKTS